MCIRDRGDLLLQSACAYQFAHLDRAGLPDTEGTVGGLVLHRGVPPAIDVNDVVGCSQGEPRTPCLQGQHEQGRPVTSRVLEPGDQSVPLTLVQPPVQVPDLAAEPGTEVSAQQVSELGILGEQQRLLPRGCLLYTS